MKPNPPIPFLDQIAPEQHALFLDAVDITAVEKSFDDSTHSLWHYNQANERRFLKLCDGESCQTSEFWSVMKLVFALDLPMNLGRYGEVYEQLAVSTDFTVPQLIRGVSSQQFNDRIFSGWLLTSFIEGTALEVNQITSDHIDLLANHLVRLHQQQSDTAGPLFKEEGGGLSPELWKQKLKAQIFQARGSSGFAEEVITEAIESVDELSIDQFQMIMPDLRWDQFLQLENGNLSLVDLDAFVWGPRALELVLLEYLLDAEQAELFKQRYSQTHLIPDLTVERKVYRVLLFQMGALGEADFKKWMSHPIRF